MLKEEIKNIRSTDKELRQFGLAVGGVLSVIGMVLLVFGKASFSYPLIPGIALIVLGLLVPKALLPLQKVWMTFGVIMGWCMTRVILSVLYFLVLTPIGIISRAAGKEFLDLKFEKERETYWRRRDPKEKGGYERQF